MKIQTNLLRFGRLALAVGGLALSAPSASAVLTTYTSGDIFIGFRQTGTSNTLVAKIGTVGDFLPTSLGGSLALGSTYNPTFGVIPGTSTAVTNLNLDLNAVFGSSWADNPTDGSGVRWGVAGFTGFSGTSAVSGLSTRSLFVTRGRTDPSTPTSLDPDPSTIGNRNQFSSSFNSFAQGSGGGSYKNQNSTVNSSVALIGLASDINNWGSRINNGSAGSFGLGSGNEIEQPFSGNFSGPTNSVLDLWLSPNTGSTLATDNTYLGSFALNNTGSLTFTAVPEPGTYMLLAIVGLFFVVFRRRKNEFN
ncbi:MAG: PEP-CTERM sorting domain-containing protein [bacterium]